MIGMGFDYPDITKSDVCVRARGRTMEKAFADMAIGAFNVVTPIEKIKPMIEKRVRIEAEDAVSLLYEWIESLIILFDSEMMVFSDFDIRITTNEKFSLSGTMRGEKIDPARHDVHSHIKAVTYHLMKIEKQGNDFVVQAILDL